MYIIFLYIILLLVSGFDFQLKRNTIAISVLFVDNLWGSLIFINEPHTAIFNKTFCHVQTNQI